MKVSLPDKKTASGVKKKTKRKDWEGSPGNLTGPSLLSLDQKTYCRRTHKTRISAGCFIHR